MIAPEYGEGSRSIVAPDSKGFWSIRGDSTYLNQTSVDDINRINDLQRQFNVDIWDKQYLIGKDGHVYLSDPMRVRTGTPTSYDMQDDLLMEAARRNIARKAKP